MPSEFLFLGGMKCTFHMEDDICPGNEMCYASRKEYTAINWTRCFHFDI